jgi:4-aminobutyrate aminotransferase / (S)-3-amino-2-methylpropionate transaminase / 5-aminovalerate transaminase
MSTRAQTKSEAVTEARGRYVARGIATTPLVVARAEGARIEDVDGRSYIDFAGGLGCQNTGHGFAAAAIHEQVDRYLHQWFMVGIYEPYVEVCRLLAELSPCGGAEQRSLLVNSGAEGVENAVKIARAATGRPAVLVFDLHDPGARRGVDALSRPPAGGRGRLHRRLRGARLRPHLLTSK